MNTAALRFADTDFALSRATRRGLVMLVAATTVCMAWPLAAQEREQSQRPRVGLVLGGGGAKGAAHIGVLKALEELHIPVDCVVGTSMGALVGGIYATGNTAAQTEERVRAIDWSETLAFTALREQSPMRRKQAGINYSNTMEFGITDKGIAAPAGIINTQHVEQTIRDLVRTEGVSDDFDKLAIPYRAVATDMQSGAMKVLANGDLAQAMRASMAVPGAFSPVIVDERVLADGGLVRNLPIDVAKSACADVVIAVWLSTPAPEAESLLSPLALISRSFDVVVDANVNTQLELLTPRDVQVVVDMQDITSGSFDRVPDAIPLGYAATMAMKEELQRFVVSAAQFSAWRTRTSRERPGEAQLAEIKVNGLKNVQADYVISSLDIKPGQAVNEKILREQMASVFALGDFENVSYRLSGDPSRALLEIDAVEKSWGPRFLRADIGLAASSQGETPFVLRADYLHYWVNRKGGEVHGAAQIGRTSLAEISLYQPINTAHRWFVEPGVVLHSSLEDLYADGDTVARFELQHGYGSIEIGRTFERLAEMRVGFRAGKARARPDIASTAISGTDKENQFGWTADFVFDTRNTPLLPTHGWLARIDYFNSTRNVNSEHNYQRLDALLQGAFRVRHDVIVASVAGGTAFNSELPIYESFVLGGPASFAGFGIGELRGSDYWLGSVGYLRKVADISKLFGQALYAGLQLQAGAMKEIPQLNTLGTYDGTMYAASVFLTARTPIGPATLSLAGASIDSWLLTFSLGRPIEEGSIMDFAR